MRRHRPPKRKTPDPFEFEKQSVIAVASVYGVDLLRDNRPQPPRESRERVRRTLDRIERPPFARLGAFARRAPVAFAVLLEQRGGGLAQAGTVANHVLQLANGYYAS